MAAPEATEPRRTPSRRTLAFIVTPLVLVWLASLIGNALTPTLVAKHPLLLVFLEPRNRNLILISQKVDQVPFMLVGFFRRVLTDPLYYLLGYLYGESAVRWVERRMGEAGSLVRGLERAFAKAGPAVVFVSPGALVCVLAGATRMRPLMFASMNVLGTITILFVLYAFGDVFDGPVSALNRFISRNFRWLTAISIGVTVLWLVDQRRRGKLEVESVSEIAEQLEEGKKPGPEDGA